MANANTLSTEEFIIRAKQIHEDKYDYSEVKYLHNKIPVKIYCKSCKSYFMQAPNKHLSGRGCEPCGILRRTHKLKSSYNDIINKAKTIHGDRYDYSEVEYTNAQTKVKIICNEHGDFYQTMAHHIYGKNGCPYCIKTKGEICVENFLIKNNINYIIQYKFDQCVNIKQLPFDFYLKEYNCCIEYDGEFHYKPARFSKDKNKMYEKLQETQFRDSIKTKFCEDNGIKLIRIPYTEFNNIESILTSELLLVNN